MTPADPRRVLVLGPSTSLPGGIATVSRAMQSEPSPGWRVEVVDSGGGRGRAARWQYPRALAALTIRPVDLVHLHVASRGSTWRKATFAALARARRKPYVIHLHGAGYRDFVAGLDRRQLRLVRTFFGHAARVVVLGESWGTFVTETLAVPHERVRVVPNGVAEVPPAIHSEGLAPTVVFTGEVGPRKGAEVLLDAAETLADRGWRFVLAGPVVDSVITERVERLQAAHPGLVDLPGPVFGAELARLVGSADIFCLPSTAEGLPMSLLEAMSAGLACVVTPVGAITEAVTDEHSALVVPVGDARSLAEALGRLMADQALRGRLGSAARKLWSEHHTAGAMVANLAAVWDESLGAVR